MRWARDEQTGLSVRPNPGTTAECPYCSAAVHAKCGEILQWHWAHTGETCELAREDATGPGGSHAAELAVPRATCPTCELWQRGCTSASTSAAVWLEHYGDAQSALARVRRLAPQCPSHVQARYYSAIRRETPQTLHPSQIID